MPILLFRFLYLRNLLTHTVNNLLQNLDYVEQFQYSVVKQKFNIIHIDCENFKTIHLVLCLIWKGRNRKSQNMEFRLKSVFKWGYFNFICYATQYKQKVFPNKKCMKFTMGQTSDSMTTMAYHFHRWVCPWCLSLAGPTVDQLGFYL